MSKTELLTPEQIEAITKCHGPEDGAVQLLLGHIQALTEHRRWIPCSERMPEMNVEVLWADALHPGEYVAAFRPQSGAVPSMYTHWQPIIPAPQEEGKPNE